MPNLADRGFYTLQVINLGHPIQEGVAPSFSQSIAFRLAHHHH
jgi:hypothetical protein